jgi:CheY-like chemotaxis protein
VNLPSGHRLEAPVLRIGTSSVFLGSDNEALRYSDGVQVTLLDRHGPVLTFPGQVASWIRKRGARIEVEPGTDLSVLEQLGEWAEEQLNAEHHPDLPRTGEASPLTVLPPRRISAPTPSSLLASPPALHATPPPVPPLDAPVLPEVWPGPRAVAPLGSNGGADVEGLPSARSALAGTRVLVIEDDVGILRLMERALKKFGCTVVGTDDPPRGLDLHAQGASDVVLMDWVLPSIPGATMLERLKRTRTTTPVAVISGALWWDDAIAQIRALGASEVMEKPIDFERLVGWLQSVRRP